MTVSNTPRYRFRDEDYELLIDRRGRRYLTSLQADKKDQNHLGNFEHNEIIGKNDGVRLTTSKGQVLLAVKPGLADFIRIMGLIRMYQVHPICNSCNLQQSLNNPGQQNASFPLGRNY